ncbi:putative zinc finger/helix-turn-helix protein, YgiT family [Chromobacterium vaccinii]|nr:putative zinc finger/helix-turn-helix protein, YgiT family [Chromobacterium vaccinii]
MAEVYSIDSAAPSRIIIGVDMTEQKSLLPVERGNEQLGGAIASRLPVVLAFPEDRPIVGRDLDTFKEYFGATVAQALAALGIQTHGRWSTIVKKNADLPVDGAIANLVRWYAAHPERFPFGQVDMPTLRLRLSINQDSFAQLFGRRKVAVSHWERKQVKPEPQVQIIAREIDDLLKSYEHQAEQERDGSPRMIVQHLLHKLDEIEQDKGLRSKGEILAAIRETLQMEEQNILVKQEATTRSLDMLHEFMDIAALNCSLIPASPPRRKANPQSLAPNAED